MKFGKLENCLPICCLIAICESLQIRNKCLSGNEDQAIANYMTVVWGHSPIYTRTERKTSQYKSGSLDSKMTSRPIAVVHFSVLYFPLIMSKIIVNPSLKVVA